MNTWKIILATLVIFGAGVITGGLLVHHTDTSHSHRPRPPQTEANAPRPGGPRGTNVFDPTAMRKQWLRMLDRELKLTSQQRERVDKILAEGQDRTSKLWEKELEKTRQQIHAELTPEQWKQYEEMRKRFRPPGPPGPPPPPGTNPPPPYDALPPSATNTPVAN